MKTKFEHIVASCQIRFDRGDPSTWKHSDFLDLSRAILRDTKVSISTNTLKRIFGKISVDEYYLPQQATIEALEKYGQNLCLSDVGVEGSPAVHATPTEPISRRFRFFWPIFFLLAMAVIGFIYLRPSTDSTRAELRFLGLEGVLPATAFFEYDAPESKDSLFLNFGDKTQWLSVKAGKNHLAHPYLYPGVFTATLQTRKKILETAQVYVRSDKWIGLGFRQGEELPKNYYEFLAAKTGKDSLFHISNEQLNARGIDTSGLVYTRLCNFTPLTYKKEDFTFEATFKNKIDKRELYCKSAQFQVSGLNKFIRFRLATPGCSHRITNLISEQGYVGTRVNLSKFTMDLSNWTTVKMINHQKKVTLYVNGKLLYTGEYKEPIGTIKGLFLEFEGTAFVKSCQLTSNDGTILYKF